MHGQGAGRRGGPAADERYRRSARIWLRAFPRRWRRAHEQEALDLLAELAPAEADRVGARDALGLVRAGWAARWRGRPGPVTWLGYRLFDAPAAARHRPWVEDDIDGLFYPLRAQYLVVVFWAFMLVNDLRMAAESTLGVGWWAAWAVALAVGFVFSGSVRRRARERHLVAQPGEPLRPGTWVAMGGPARRIPASWMVSRALVAAVAALVLGLSGTALAPSAATFRPLPAGFEVVAGSATDLRLAAVVGWLCAAVAGGVLAARARRLLGDRLAGLPTQPERELVRPGREPDAWLGVAVLVAGVATWGEVSGATVLWLGPWLVGTALVLGPRLLVLRAAAAARDWRAPDGTALAWADLSLLGRSREEVRVDGPQRVVRRWDGPYVPGQTVLGPASADPPWPPIPA